MLHTNGRLELPRPLDEWIDAALAYPGVRHVELSRTIAVDSCRLPGVVHRDPADRILIATARELDCPLVTQDDRILRYEHVRALVPEQLRDF